MSSPLAVSNLIESAVAQLDDTLFLRATDAEANVSIDNIDMSEDDVAIYNNKSTSSSALSELSGNIETEWPIEIHFLSLADFDDNDVDADTLSDPLYVKAEKLFDFITQRAELSQITLTDGYEIDMGNPVKLYDKTLTGVTLSFTMMYSRAIRCAPVSELVYNFGIDQQNWLQIVDGDSSWVHGSGLYTNDDVTAGIGRESNNLNQFITSLQAFLTNVRITGELTSGASAISKGDLVLAFNNAPGPEQTVELPAAPMNTTVPFDISFDFTPQGFDTNILIRQIVAIAYKVDLRTITLTWNGKA